MGGRRAVGTAPSRITPRFCTMWAGCNDSVSPPPFRSFEAGNTTENGFRLMRILHILRQLRASGAEQMLRVAAPYWRAEGLELHALETSSEPGHFTQDLEAAGYHVARLPLQRRASDISALSKFMRQGRYDVVHVHPEGADLIPIVAARLAGVPAIVRTVHHIYPYRGFLRQRKRWERRFTRALGTHHICNSKSGSKNEQETLQNPHTLVFNWYDDEHFQPPTRSQREAARRSIGVEGDRKVFVSVGGCAEYKNHDLILQALTQVPGVLYLHAGPEPDDSERRLANELGLKEQVRFLGVVPDVAEVFHAADGYLMPSTIEGFGVAAAEALGCAVPVILSDRPALWDLKDLFPGTWVPLGVDELASAMRSLAEKTDDERRSEGEKASIIAKKNFGAKVGADGYLRVYRDAMAGRP